ncbi:MAG: rod shape-determining protein MreC [Lachnospira sp.]|jgi:rod shape-determining protein MreC|uniref:rod shape-determining protein MreC n=1 Tax=Lachnospira sp. TaxID=2049031 RepID=UPI003011CA65|nr:rod shape-determining protein MreC [Lachnospira sp.]
MKKKVSSFMTSKYILIVLTAVCLIFISTSFFTDRLVAPLRSAISMVVVPLQKGMNNLGLWTYDKYTTLQEISVVLDENKELKSKVDDLTEENNQLRQDTYELSRLRELYQLDEKYTGYTKVGARIIEVTADNWSKAFKVDKGSDDGIQKDMNVIAGGGLVGIVTEVGKNYSIIKTIIEDNNSVSGMLIDTNETCIVEGDIEQSDSGFVKLTHFKSDITVRDGDKVVTSNISDKYLQGILIGYAKDVTPDSNNLTQSGYLVPAVDFNNLQEVLIITEMKKQ